jgi:putative SOS response-associated peptidase YedK
MIQSMCGRFTLTSPGEMLADEFELAEPPALAPRYNIAPAQEVVLVRRERAGAARRLARARWGFVPAWPGTPWRRGPLVNARAETAARAPAFREAFLRRRCLVPADGFYEWRPEPASRSKQPWLVRRRDARPFALAGLWEPPAGGDGPETLVLLTTEPNALVAPIHDRMPLILPREACDAWLDPACRDAARLSPLLQPYPEQWLEAFAVGRAVNDPAREGPECVAPEPPRQGRLL